MTYHQLKKNNKKMEKTMLNIRTHDRNIRVLDKAIKDELSKTYELYDEISTSDSIYINPNENVINKEEARCFNSLIQYGYARKA